MFLLKGRFIFEVVVALTVTWDVFGFLLFFFKVNHML